MSPERYQAYMRNYMRDYQRQKRDRTKYNDYMKGFQARLREAARKIFCPRCEVSFVRRRYERRPICPGCGCSFC